MTEAGTGPIRSSPVELTLAGQLSAHEEEVVAAAVQLWDGIGDAYLGNSWSDMVAAVSSQMVRSHG